MYLNICILHTDAYSQHHFINFHFQNSTKLVKMFKKIRSVSKIKKKTDKKVNITPCIEIWPKFFYRIFDQTMWEFFRLLETIFEIFRILILKISQNKTTVLFTSHVTRSNFLANFIFRRGWPPTQRYLQPLAASGIGELKRYLGSAKMKR